MLYVCMYSYCEYGNTTEKSWSQRGGPARKRQNESVGCCQPRPIIKDDHIGLYAGQSYMVIFDDRGKAAR